jgi:hypothetical protein
VRVRPRVPRAGVCGALRPDQLRGLLREQRVRRRKRAGRVRQRRGDLRRLHGDGHHVQLRRRLGRDLSVRRLLVLSDDVPLGLLRREWRLPGGFGRRRVRKSRGLLPNVPGGLAMRGPSLLQPMHTRNVPLGLLRRPHGSDNLLARHVPDGMRHRRTRVLGMSGRHVLQQSDLHVSATVRLPGRLLRRARAMLSRHLEYAVRGRWAVRRLHADRRAMLDSGLHRERW